MECGRTEVEQKCSVKWLIPHVQIFIDCNDKRPTQLDHKVILTVGLAAKSLCGIWVQTQGVSQSVDWMGTQEWQAKENRQQSQRKQPRGQLQGLGYYSGVSGTEKKKYHQGDEMLITSLLLQEPTITGRITDILWQGLCRQTKVGWIMIDIDCIALLGKKLKAGLGKISHQISKGHTSR